MSTYQVKVYLSNDDEVTVSDCKVGGIERGQLTLRNGEGHVKAVFAGGHWAYFVTLPPEEPAPEKSVAAGKRRITIDVDHGVLNYEWAEAADVLRADGRSQTPLALEAIALALRKAE